MGSEAKDNAMANIRYSSKEDVSKGMPNELFGEVDIYNKASILLDETF